MAGLGDYRLAIQMRDIVEKLTRNIIDTERPRYKYATVQSIDRTNRKCSVTFTGDSTPVTVSMGSIQPSATGQIVRVGGIGTDRFIEDVMGEAYFGSATESYIQRSQTMLTGGGVHKVATTYEVSWSKRFLTMGFGRSAGVDPSGFHSIEVPPVGTVIHGHGGETDQTVNSSGIPLIGAWRALYYDLPVGSTSTSLADNFHIVNYTSDFEVPSTWILLAIVNNDNMAVRFASGPEIRPGGIYRTGGNVQPGFLQDYAGGSIPSGWLACNGGFVSQTTYDELFAVVGHSYNNGVDPGDGTFKLPDFRDRQAVGTSGSKALGSTGGNTGGQVTLADVNMPDHSHTLSHTHTMAHTHTIAHDHGIDISDAAGGNNSRVARGTATSVTIANGPVRGSNTPDSGGSSAGSTGGASTATTSTYGSATPTAVTTQDPYVAVTKMIKF